MKRKWIINIVRNLPIILSIYVIIIGLSVLFDFYNPFFTSIPVAFLGLGGFVSQLVFLLLSKELKFCKAHRLIIYNLMFISFIRFLESNNISIDYDIYLAIIPTTILLIIYAINTVVNGTYTKKKTN